jgi:exocyst complex component 7
MRWPLATAALATAADQLYRRRHPSTTIAMDDESADIELLEQHLNRSRQLSTRMTSVLQKFDRRLQTLEKSILPLHKSTQSLTRLVESRYSVHPEHNVPQSLLLDIDKTLQSLEKIATPKPQSQIDEALILRGQVLTVLYRGFN